MQSVFVLTCFFFGPLYQEQGFLGFGLNNSERDT